MSYSKVSIFWQTKGYCKSGFIVENITKYFKENRNDPVISNVENTRNGFSFTFPQPHV